MTELVIPPALDQAQVTFRYVDPSGFSASRYNGAGQTTSYGGDRVGATIDFSKCGGSSLTGAARRAQLKAFLMALRGRQNRVYLTDVSSSRQGVFSASELCSNADFASGTTGWTTSNGFTMTASNGVARLAFNGLRGGSPQLFQDVANFVPFVPYACRTLYIAGQGLAAFTIGPRLDSNSGAWSGNNPSLTRGYLVSSLTPGTATGNIYGAIASISGGLAGDFILLPFVSAARCLRVDGGGRLTFQSDDITNPSWTKSGTTASADMHTAPDGTTTADKLTENGSNSPHIMLQTQARTTGATDLCASGYFVRSAGTRDVELSVGNDVSNYSRAIFTLSGAGTAGTVTNVGTATSGRAFIKNCGNGWYYCSLISRAAPAITVFVQAGMVSGGTTVSYAGDSTSALGVWDFGASASAEPTRASKTTTTAVAASTQDGGVGLYVKGGRTPSEGALAGALVAGDWVEIDGQLCMATVDLDLDALGMGFLCLSPPPRRPVANNTPIIVHKPMGRFMYPGDSLGWDNQPGLISSAQIELVQAFAA